MMMSEMLKMNCWRQFHMVSLVLVQTISGLLRKLVTDEFQEGKIVMAGDDTKSTCLELILTEVLFAKYFLID